MVEREETPSRRIAFCRIGVFYDGSYVSYAQRYFFHNRKLGWLQLRSFHSLLESYIRTKEQGYANYRIVYAAWFQGLFPISQGNEQHLKAVSKEIWTHDDSRVRQIVRRVDRGLRGAFSGTRVRNWYESSRATRVRDEKCAESLSCGSRLSTHLKATTVKGPDRVRHRREA